MHGDEIVRERFSADSEERLSSVCTPRHTHQNTIFNVNNQQIISKTKHLLAVSVTEINTDSFLPYYIASSLCPLQCYVIM